MYTRTDVFLSGADVYVDGQNVGWTRGGVRLRTNKSMWFRPSMSGLGDEGVVKQSEEFYISTVLVESTFENLKKAWGIAEGITNVSATSLRKRLNFGGSTTVPVHSLKFIARSRTQSIGFYRVVAVDFGEIVYSRNTDAVIPVTFRALLDTTKSVGQQIGYCELGPILGETDFVAKVTVRNNSSTNFIARVGVNFEDRGTKGLVSRVQIHLSSTRSLTSRATVAYAAGTSNLVCRLTAT